MGRNSGHLTYYFLPFKSFSRSQSLSVECSYFIRKRPLFRNYKLEEKIEKIGTFSKWSASYIRELQFLLKMCAGKFIVISYFLEGRFYYGSVK